MSKRTTISPSLLWAVIFPIRTLLFAILFVRLGLWIPTYSRIFFLISLPLFLYYIYRVLYIATTKYELNADHIRYTRGLLGIKDDYINYYRIKDLRRYRSLFMRIIGVMEVTLITSDRSEPILTLKGLPLSNVQEYLRNEVEMARLRNGVYEVDAV